MIYCCDDRLRLGAVAAHPSLNGIEFAEVIDTNDALQQRTLLIHCLKPPSSRLSRRNVCIEGGERIRSVGVEWAAPASPLPSPLTGPNEAATAAIVSSLPDAAKVLVVRVDQAGDFSTYRLRLVASEIDDSRHPDFDPLLCTIDFRFRAATQLDCLSEPVASPDDAPAADINYLARDYATLRRMLLDRMEQLIPQWERSSAVDYGVALIELLAFVGDQLSYQQDAVATEAYIQTARQRTSLRRHALLADYAVDEGINARTWLQMEVTAAAPSLDPAVHFLTRCPGSPALLEAGSDAHAKALLAKPLTFAPLHRPLLRAEHNNIRFYTWGDAACCLPAGATRATLTGRLASLRANEPLLFEEVLSPQTGRARDADPNKRHVLRVTSVSPTVDPLNGTPITEITWSEADALPFALVISALTDSDWGSRPVNDCSLARGNLMLVDHGERILDEPLGEVPWPAIASQPSISSSSSRFRPRLRQSPVTYAATSPLRLIGTAADNAEDATQGASAAMRAVGSEVPQIILKSRAGKVERVWTPVNSLLNSGSGATHFVVETDNEGTAWLRFGDGEHGLRPEPATQFWATYRIGNGKAGNIGRDSIAHMVGSRADVAAAKRVYQPLPASGGTDAESSESIRLNISEASRSLERAVTVSDYAAVAQQFSRRSRATATLRWTGSWHTVFITADPDDDAQHELLSLLDRYRMAGQDVKVTDPLYVPIELGLRIQVAAEYARSDLQRRLMQLFSERLLPDGRRGFFHPDNFAYGQSVFASQIYAAVHEMPGIASAAIFRFKRQHLEEDHTNSGQLILGRNEIAQLANDPNFPERGVLRLEISGGR